MDYLPRSIFTLNSEVNSKQQNEVGLDGCEP